MSFSDRQECRYVGMAYMYKYTKCTLKVLRDTFRQTLGHWLMGGLTVSLVEAIHAWLGQWYVSGV